MTSFSSALHDCATECALRRKNRRCGERFGSYACNDCKYNINRYIHADPRHVELFMVDAEMKAGAIKAVSGSHHVVFVVLIGICLFFAWTGYQAEREMASRPAARTVPAHIAAPVTNAQHDHIMNTLQTVARYIERGHDVNRDGLTNCIDAAVLFYQYFPNKNQVTISVNRNPATGMHHLFNVVLIDGSWRAIEPQAVWAKNRSYFMRDIWGAKYDSSLNRVVTNDYLRYVR